MVTFPRETRSSIEGTPRGSWLFTAQDAVTLSLPMRLRVSLPTCHPGLPTAGTRDSLKECFKGHPSRFTADTGSGISCSAQGWRGGWTAPHSRDSGFPEETESILKTGSGAGKAELLGQRGRLRRTKWQPTPVFLPKESRRQRSLSMGSHRVRHT